MDTMQFRLAEIRVNEDRAGDHLVEYLHFDHDRRQSKPFHLFAVAEIHSSLYLYERLLDALHAAMSQAKTFVSGMDGDPMVRFEKVIQRLNEALYRVTQEEAAEVRWDLVNLYVFQLAEGHLCFSGVGSLSNLFLQRQSHGEAKAFDLLGSLEQPETFDPRKPLASIVCGNINVGDLLFVGTQNVQRYRESLELVRFLQDHPPVAAATEIQQRAIQLGLQDHVFGLVIAGVALTQAKAILTSKPLISAEPIIDEPDEMAPAAVQSVQEFYATEQETDSLLDDGAPVDSASVRARAGSIFSDLWRKVRPDRSQRGDISSSFASPVSLSGLRSMNSGYAKTLLDKNRALAIGGIIGVIVLGGIGLWVHSVRTKQAEQKLWTAVYDQAVEAKNRAEAALVYGDEDRARAQYTQATNAFKQLDTSTPDRQTTRSALEKDLNEIRARLRRELLVPSPETLTDFGSAQAGTKAKGLVMQNKKIYSVDQASGSVLQYDLSTNVASVLTAPEGVRLSLVGSGQTSPLFVTDGGAYYTIRSGEIVAFPTSGSKASSTVAVTSYGQRVYALDPQTQMVWRWNANGSGLSSPTAYLKNPATDLTGASTLAIDSSVYVGTNSGTIHKFLSGQRENWSPATIDPTLGNVNHLWTQADAAYLIVTDTTNKRIILFNKDGSLAQQLTSPAFRTPNAAWADPTQKLLYVLDENRVLRMSLP